MRPTPLSVSLVVPETADEIRVRLIPIDQSIAVTDRGKAVFERVSLAPSEWPTELPIATLRLRRVRVVAYEAARRYTRATLAVSERTPDDLASTWRALADLPVEPERARRILAGQLARGMSPEQVLLAWGEPERRIDLGAVERWEWAGRSAAFDTTGLAAWTRPAEIETEEARQCLTSSGGA